MGKVKHLLGMTEDEAYADYVAFCKENGFACFSKKEFLQFMVVLESEFGDIENE